MICIDCGYEIPYEKMVDVGIKKISCIMCGAKNESGDSVQCPSCEEEIPYAYAKQYHGRNVPCTKCETLSNYNLHPSSQYKIVPSVHDILENPATAMVPSPRPAQVKVGRAVQTALHTKESCIAEAGTGTGKTLAYLVPALAMGKRVIVATATKALQDQIMLEDGPWVLDELKRLGLHRTIAVKKGKGNSACVKDFLNIKESLLEKEDRPEEVHRMQKWFDAAEKGDHDADLNFYSDAPDWVDRVRVDECAKSKCSMCKACGYYRNLVNVDTADMVVTNHTLVALEYMISSRTGDDRLKHFIFGDRDAIVFDEAHQLESAFENVWREELNPFTVKRTLKRLREGFAAGPPPATGEELHRLTIARDENGEATDVAEIRVGCSYVGMEEIGAYDEETGKTLQRNIQLLGDSLDYPKSNFAVIDEETLPVIYEPLKKVYACLDYLRRGLQGLYNSLREDISDPMRSTEDALEELREVKPLYRRLGQWRDLVRTWLDCDPEYVQYVTRDIHPKYGTSYTLVRQPIDLARALQWFWKENKTVIFSSATMSKKAMGKPSFNLFQSRLGTHIDADQCRAIKSPFNYKTRSAMYVTRDKKLRPPKYNASERKKSAYYDDLAKEIEEWTSLTRGNALVLFASAYDLEQVYNRVITPYPIHAQFNDSVPANVALERYMADAKEMCKRDPREGPILFGLQSFWEGVSIKGPYLLNVILTRMPFPVPTDPLFQKRQEKLGKHAFSVLSLYPVSISARQGTGRLMRTMKDAGIVAILDERVGSSRWGAQVVRELDVSANTVYTKSKMKKAWGHIDRYMNRMLKKTKAST